MSDRPGYEGPNYTQIPNALLDDNMPHMKEAELRVVLAICRQTFGWHKDADELSLTQLEAKTGLSRQGVINGIEAALKSGLIERHKTGKSFTYSVIVHEVDKSTKLTSNSQPSGLTAVNEVDTQKKQTN